MVKNFLIILISLILILLLGTVLYYFYIDFFKITNIFAKVGSSLILSFTTIIIIRYMLLLFFSILKIILKSSKNIDYRSISTDEKVTIIVPAFNEEKVIVTSIKSLINQTYPNIEILIVDDGSTDKTFLKAKEFEFENENKSLKVLTKPNGGKAKAINYGILHSTGSLIMVVDADSKLDKNAVLLMTRFFEDEDIAAVAGSVYVSNQTNIWTKLQALEYIEGLNMVRNGQAFLKLVNIIPGPIGMFRKKALFDVGLYDNDTYAEDCDLTLKLISKGYKIDFEPDAIAYTEAPENLLDLIKQRYRWTRGILQAINKHKSLLWNFKINPSATFTMWYMLFESVFWPFMDIWTNLFIIYFAFFSGYSILMFYWWSMFTILDVTGAIYCILVTGEKISLILYAIYYRLFFIQIINIAKILSTFEEWFNIEMSWEKLERKGNL